jgi:hypothetical protein
MQRKNWYTEIWLVYTLTGDINQNCDLYLNIYGKRIGCSTNIEAKEAVRIGYITGFFFRKSNNDFTQVRMRKKKSVISNTGNL